MNDRPPYPGDRVRFPDEQHQRALEVGTGTVLLRDDRDGTPGVYVRFDHFSATYRAPCTGWWADADLVVAARVGRSNEMIAERAARSVLTSRTYWVDGQQVTVADYVAAERAAGYHNSQGRPDQPATSAWKGPGPDGQQHTGRIGYISARWDTTGTEHHQ